MVPSPRRAGVDVLVTHRQEGGHTRKLDTSTGANDMWRPELESSDRLVSACELRISEEEDKCRKRKSSSFCWQAGSRDPRRCFYGGGSFGLLWPARNNVRKIDGSLSSEDLVCLGACAAPRARGCLFQAAVLTSTTGRGGVTLSASPRIIDIRSIEENEMKADKVLQASDMEEGGKRRRRNPSTCT
ncbi:hypothetical protein B0H17DRAFT_1140609 [Mycena rosella]|uniref:Uncharacterized protein n=1 Tax=Mycena rosella TaxID=1033263 RepID=A0AAD7G788_MYCRO|nr:hypothetical protein B0H17DRAFT_1140609 [Mycena rosella]